jgi:hypothetical protein
MPKVTSTGHRFRLTLNPFATPVPIRCNQRWGQLEVISGDMHHAACGFMSANYDASRPIMAFGQTEAEQRRTVRQLGWAFWMSCQFC